MRIYYDSTLIKELTDAYLFLDTTAFVTAFSYEREFGELLKSIKESNCAILTIPSVVFEFTRGAASLNAYNERVSFITNLATIYPIERHLEELQGIKVALQKIGSQMSYTDFLLGVCLYKFQRAYLLTENYKDFSTSIYERTQIITIDNDKEIRNHAIYKLSKEKLDKIVEGLLAP